MILDLTCGCPLKMSPTRYRAIVAGMNHKDETVKSDSYTNTSVIDRINFQPPLAPLPETPFEEMSLAATPARYGTKHEKSRSLPSLIL